MYRSTAVLACVLLVAFCGTVRAASIHQNVTPLGGNTFEAIYSVTNDGSLGNDVSIASFQLLFDPVLYDETSLTAASSDAIAAAWDELFLASGIGVPAAYDALALDEGVAPGETLSGFAVRFAWLGDGQPGVQPFEVFDPLTFELLGTGTTVVPLPAALPLLAAGLAMVFGVVRRKRPKGTARVD